MAQRKNSQAPSQAQLKRIAKEVQFVRELVMALEAGCKPAATRAAWEAAIDNLQSIGSAFKRMGVTLSSKDYRTSSGIELTSLNCNKPFEIVRGSDSLLSGWRRLCNWLRKVAPEVAGELAKLDMLDLLRGKDELCNELNRMARAAPIPHEVNSLFVSVGMSSSEVILTLVGAPRFYTKDPDRFVKPPYQPHEGRFLIQCLRPLAAIGKRLPESKEFIDYALVPAVAGLLVCEVLPKLAPRKQIVIGHASGDIFEITPRAAKKT